MHSHISLNISKFQSFLKIVSNFSPCWSTHQVLAWLECTVTGINWATSCVQTPIKHLKASSPALSERNKVSCFILIWWGPVLQWILELTDVVKTGSFDVHDFCCQPQFSAFVCFCHESEIARHLDRKARCGWAHGIHFLPHSCRKVASKWSRNCPEIVPKLSQSCLKVVPKLTGRIGWLRMGAWYPLPAYLLIHRCAGWSGHMQTHSDTNTNTLHYLPTCWYRCNGWTHANTLRYNWKVDKHNNN